MSCRCPDLVTSFRSLRQPELRCIYGLMFGIVEALEELGEVALRQLVIGAGDF